MWSYLKKLLHTLGELSWQEQAASCLLHNSILTGFSQLVQQFPSGIKAQITEFHPTLKENSLLNHHLIWTFTVKESSLQALCPIWAVENMEWEISSISNYRTISLLEHPLHEIPFSICLKHLTPIFWRKTSSIKRHYACYMWELLFQISTLEKCSLHLK